jgi:hypothetical protein
LQSYSATILVLYLAVGFVCSTTVLLEQSYAQENPPEGGGLMPDGELSSGDLSSGGGGVDLSSGGGGGANCSPGFYESNGECIPEGPTSQPQVGGGISQPQQQPQQQPQPQVGGGLLPPIISGPVDRIIDTDPRGFVEDTFSTINEKSPVPPLLIAGVVAVVAIGAGVASFSRHHHSHSSPSPSAQHQVQQEDTKEEQIYEDVQIVTQGGIEEV